MSGGGTNFGEALKYALEVAKRPHNNNFELFHFIMMSDGEDAYPNTEV
jgi:Mg-chelatase subunit ChlD